MFNNMYLCKISTLPVLIFFLYNDFPHNTFPQFNNVISLKHHAFLVEEMQYHQPYAFFSPFLFFLCRDHLADFANNYQTKFMLGYCSIYIFMQTFMIPGTIFLSLLAGSIFGVVKGVLLVVFTATLGASSCYLLSKLIGRPIISWLWPEKLRFFQAEVLLMLLITKV